MDFKVFNKRPKEVYRAKGLDKQTVNGENETKNSTKDNPKRDANPQESEKLTKKCANCGETVSKSDTNCWNCRKPTNRENTSDETIDKVQNIIQKIMDFIRDVILFLTFILVTYPVLLYVLGYFSEADMITYLAKVKNSDFFVKLRELFGK